MVVLPGQEFAGFDSHFQNLPRGYCVGYCFAVRRQLASRVADLSLSVIQAIAVQEDDARARSAANAGAKPEMTSFLRVARVALG